MTVSRAFDLAQWVGTPVNVNDGVVVGSLGPPFTAQFKPVVTSVNSGVVVAASIPAANAQGQTLIAGAGPTYAWTLGVPTGGGIADAPSDGTTYGRNNAAWVAVVSGGGGGIPDAPSDGTSYVRQNGAWINVIDCGVF